MTLPLNIVRLGIVAGFGALPWRKLTVLAMIGILIGFGLAVAIPLRVS